MPRSISVLLASLFSLAFVGPTLAQPKPVIQEKPAAATTQPVPAVDPRRPSAIEAQDVPVVPPEVAERLGQYASVRSAAFQGWDPAGKGILIATRLGNAAQLYRVY